jgi:predicted DCC family thiol-disulfide oxidoreductase YuxK
MPTPIIILFDDNCLVCNRLVQFLLKHDKNKTMLFTSLKGKWAKEQEQKYKLLSLGDTIIVIKDEQTYTHSSAVLEIVKHLPLPWKLISIFTIVPKCIRDAFYRLFAKYRLKLKPSNCLTLSSEDQDRFI